jgi:hypothetical protein
MFVSAVVVLSYDLLKDVASLLEGLAFQVVVLDESHCIKNPKVQQQDGRGGGHVCRLACGSGCLFALAAVAAGWRMMTKYLGGQGQ